DAVRLDGRPWLDYQHFSVMLSSTRRLARQVVWNIDVATLRADIPRSGLRFQADPRIAPELQVLDDVYADNRIDRGHLARRADLLWGATIGEARRANRDSFYFPNITPQMDSFNQSGKAGDWGLIENSLSAYLRDTPLPRATVFAGPLLQADDPLYRGVAVPLSFWKALAYRVEDELTCKAFLVTQSLAGLESITFDEQYLIHGLPLRDLQERTQLHFAQVLHDANRAPTGLRPTRSIIEDPFAIDWTR
ncbi:MAG: DNA/RNA non-specific endonuclease, partial [Micrococcales bacterium]|nr:DNA/RNA non-specific endonuclease [Micrococcales bacterium]